jgi:ABC-2 type transport system ATP-binding protein
VEALKGLTLNIEEGEIFGFLGPNGAGKSTTIKALMGLIRPTSGNACIMGKDISSTESRRHVGYLPENPAFYDYLSAEEYLNFVGKSFGMQGSTLKEKAQSVLVSLDLWDARKRPVRGYSKGMLQRVGIAQALIHDPQVYILDEPMSGLDPVGRAMVKEIMTNLKSRGKTVFFSTHITSDVETVCDRVGVVLKGDLRRVERVASIMQKGIIGYNITIRNGRTSETDERYIQRDNLSAAIEEIKSSGAEISLIEPKRKNLEDFFIEIVSSASQR